MARDVLSVGQINEYIRTVMDRDLLLSAVAVRGEISNYKFYPSGHHYFTLKDEAGALKCVMFKGSAVNLKFRPENGMKVVAMGKISVFPRDGAYQLYCSAIILDGIGDLYVAFEQLKKKLEGEGLFRPEHKKSLPQYPKTICIITSEAGAAVHDMLRILRKRFPLVKVLLLPVRVQGAEAPAEIVSAIRYANFYSLGDMLIVGRGGGSIEDLWAFNDELVARAIFDSKIPVISAVGHEPDVTIADYVADLRAATPSNGAEFAVPDKDVLMQNLDSLQSAMYYSIMRNITSAKRHLRTLSQRETLLRPEGYVHLRMKDLSHLSHRLLTSQIKAVDKEKQNFMALTAKLDALSPLKVLTRGYTIAERADGRVLRSVSDVKPADNLRLIMSDGSISVTVQAVKENING